MVTSTQIDNACRFISLGISVRYRPLIPPPNNPIYWRECRVARSAQNVRMDKSTEILLILGDVKCKDYPSTSHTMEELATHSSNTPVNDIISTRGTTNDQATVTTSHEVTTMPPESNILVEFQTEIFAISLAITIAGAILNCSVILLILRPGNILSLRSMLHLCLTLDGLLMALASNSKFIIAIHHMEWVIDCKWYATVFHFIGCIANYTLAVMSLERLVHQTRFH